MDSTYMFDWAELAFGSKKPLRSLKATFVAAPRELSPARLAQLIKNYLPKGNIVLGLAKEPYVAGLENQPQFAMLQQSAVQELIDQVNAKAVHKIYTLSYFQRETSYIIEKGGFARAVLVNGSWKYTFHTSPVFYALVKAAIPYELVSPFASEQEARDYEMRVWPQIQAVTWPIEPSGTYAAPQMLEFANAIARQSYDYSFQTGVTLGGPLPDGRYTFVAAAFNKVVPFQTYALHYGNSRETHFSPPGDLNHYDTVHAEVNLLIELARRGIDASGNTMFINLLPCPTCARMLSQTDITEFIYTHDHSDGYAIDMLQKAGKTVRRVPALQ